MGLAHLSSRTALLALLALLVMTTGFTACGKRGDPLPPLQHIPAPTPKARVSQRGAVIVIEWEAPSKTTDGSELRLKQVEVLRRIVEPPPPALEAPEAPEAPETPRTEGDTVSGGDPEASAKVPPSTTPASPTTPTAPTAPTADAVAQPDQTEQQAPPTEASTTPVESGSASQETGEETTSTPAEGQTEGAEEGEEPLVLAVPPSILQVSLKPKKFAEEARIVAKLDVDLSGGPLSFEDEWKPRWKGKKLAYAVRYVNPKGLRGAHSRPTSIDPAPPLPAPSQLSVAADDGFVKIAWAKQPDLAEWHEAAEVSAEEGVTFELGFNVYRKPGDGAYPSAATLNRKPLVESVFEDRNVKFGRDWCWVVRGVAVPIQPELPEKEEEEEEEGPELDMPSEEKIPSGEQIAEAVSQVANALPGVAGELRGAAGINLEKTKQILPPEPPPLIESESTDEVCLKPIDTFPPPAPARLVALETPAGIMISWSESDARDLQGFFVYRADKRRGPFELLTKEPIRLPSYTDSDLSPGQTYFYAVSAVDSAKPPNESERSSPIAAKAPK